MISLILQLDGPLNAAAAAWGFGHILSMGRSYGFSAVFGYEHEFLTIHEIRCTYFMNMKCENAYFRYVCASFERT